MEYYLVAKGIGRSYEFNKVFNSIAETLETLDLPSDPTTHGKLNVVCRDEVKKVLM